MLEDHDCPWADDPDSCFDKECNQKHGCRDVRDPVVRTYEWHNYTGTATRYQVRQSEVDSLGRVPTQGEIRERLGLEWDREFGWG
ncbi:MAG: hypothetical protein ACI8RZ_003366 [Myxococcota bacterium]|jgi:hypothetical protein